MRGEARRERAASLALPCRVGAWAPADAPSLAAYPLPPPASWRVGAWAARGRASPYRVGPSAVSCRPFCLCRWHVGPSACVRFGEIGPIRAAQGSTRRFSNGARRYVPDSNTAQGATCHLHRRKALRDKIISVDDETRGLAGGLRLRFNDLANGEKILGQRDDDLEFALGFGHVVRFMVRTRKLAKTRLCEEMVEGIAQHQPSGTIDASDGTRDFGVKSHHGRRWSIEAGCQPGLVRLSRGNGVSTTAAPYTRTQ